MTSSPTSERSGDDDLRELPPPAYHLDYSLTVGATSYSTLTGILAGFAFAAIILLIDRWGDASAVRGRSDAHVQATLICLLGAVISLIIATFLYGTTGAESQEHSLRTSHMNLFASFAAVSGVLLLFYGLNWVLGATDLRSARDAVARMSTVAVPLVVYFYLAISVVDETTIAKHCAAWDTTTGSVLQWATVAFAIAVVAFASYGWDKPVTRRIVSRLATPAAAARITWAGRSVVVVSGIVVGFASEGGEPRGYSDLSKALMMLATLFVLTIWISWPCERQASSLRGSRRNVVPSKPTARLPRSADDHLGRQRHSKHPGATCPGARGYGLRMGRAVAVSSPRRPKAASPGPLRLSLMGRPRRDLGRTKQLASEGVARRAAPE